MKPARLERIRQVASQRQMDLAVCLENVHDPHNISAVIRTCDAVGIADVYILYSAPQLRDQPFAAGKKSSAGSRRWVRTHLFRETEACFAHLRQRYDRIYCTWIDDHSQNLYDLDLTTSTVLVFGNEHDGISAQARALSDGSYRIPMVGMVRSLNISVACAVSLYEALRQRDAAGLYALNAAAMTEVRQELFDHYCEQQILRSGPQDP